MSALFKHLRVHQIFGANTDVGKTVFTTALLRASLQNNNPAFYLKPVSTGPLDDADDLRIKTYTSDRIRTDCLFRFSRPVSPHLAAKDSPSIPSDSIFLAAISSHIRRCAASVSQPSHMYVETAGGVHSPTLLGTSQADCYRPLFLPTILIGDSKLGGISSTISAYESLVLRGYIIDAVLLFKDDIYRNWEYLSPFFADRGIRVGAVDAPPPLKSNQVEDRTTTSQYYDRIIDKDHPDNLLDIVDHLHSCHESRIQELDSMPGRALNSIWWPFVQHGQINDEREITVIDSACTDFFSVYKKPEDAPHSLLEWQLDGSASWWTQAVGHAHPRLTLAAARAAGRYGHVMFPKNTHLPALKLAESLLAGPGRNWASRTFFTDDGSTGMEVALKMALRAYSVWSKREESTAVKQLGVIGLKGSYHGDTIGVMDACEQGVYTCEWHNAKGYWLDPPTIGMNHGKVRITLPSSLGGELIEAASIHSVYDVAARMSSSLAQVYRDFLRKTLSRLRKDHEFEMAALVLEPLVMGAGGMIFVDPLFQRILVDVARETSSSTASKLPVIFDEVFVGLYRLGMESAGPVLGVNPDISVNAKILTGGLVPLAVTLTSDLIFKAFHSNKKADALLHGHSYTAHAVGCEVANETLSMVEELRDSQLWKDAQARWGSSLDETGTCASSNVVWSHWDPVFVQEISTVSCVAEVMALGTVFVIRFKDDEAGYLSGSAENLLQALSNSSDTGSFTSTPDGTPYSVHYRTLGNVAYFMTSLNTPEETIRSVEDKIWTIIGGKSGV